ncbi:hypothetical protein CCACVL1_04439 [Corchorus capsularis]|uniref:Uncharacterized protein n=1 Tax=Corchorus capsularis TaxID=210143 RepID=A0A1R3JT18_COCAP|nr:hypothetical protein CCACVL1_04439 [Corchorus capsularis]
MNDGREESVEDEDEDDSRDDESQLIDEEDSVGPVTDKALIVTSSEEQRCVFGGDVEKQPDLFAGPC